MCISFNQDENANLKAGTTKACTPTVSLSEKPSSLQWVAVGKGGKVSSVKTVRSHVSKGYHQRKRDSQKADLEKLTWQRHVELRPHESTSKLPEEKIDITTSESGGPSEDECVSPISVDKSHVSPSLSPISIVQHPENLIPYAWFEKNGPILYVNRSNWPFQQQLVVTGSDRKDLGEKTLTPRQSGWMPGIRSLDFMAVKGAVLDPTVLLWIGQSPECFQFRVETIKWIQDQLGDAVTAISDKTLGSIMTIAMWTAGYSNLNEINSHIDAIEKIVKLRGGFEGFNDDGVMVAKLTLFDSMIAILTGETPRLPRVAYFVSSPISPARNLYMTHQVSPLYGLGNFESIITYTKDQFAIVSLLSKMWIMTQLFDLYYQPQRSTELESLGPILPFVKKRPADHKTPLLTLPLLSRCANPAHNHVLETLLSTSIIYSHSLTFPPTDFPSPKNEVAFQQLCTAFAKCSDDDFWVCYPGILLWVLLIGTASARGKPSSAFWMFYLSRTGNFTNTESWLTGSAAMRRFLDIQKWIRETGGV